MTITRKLDVIEEINANIRRIKVTATDDASAVSQDISDLQTDDETTVHTSDDITALSPLGEAFQDDLAVDANGTAIAAAVNGLRDVLIAAGLMDADS